MQHAAFVTSEDNRRRYWARSAIGWRRIAGARPNDAHRALVGLETAGIVSLVVTQNVDGLHARAGQRNLVELHGSLERVTCLNCGAGESRERVQERLVTSCPALAGLAAEARPDGDATVADDIARGVTPPSCDRCGGILMPDVVFFGGAVPRERVTRVSAALERAPALLIVGSSLVVYSGFRLARQAHAAGRPVAALNLGVTRADEFLSHHWRQDAADALAGALEELRAGEPAQVHPAGIRS